MKKEIKKTNHWCCSCGGEKFFWGFLFLLMGLWYLARDVGYITTNISLWPFVLIFLGLWILLKRGRNTC